MVTVEPPLLLDVTVTDEDGTFLAGSATAADKFLIVPGVSVGSVKVGDTQIQVARKWGSPSRKTPMGKTITWIWGASPIARTVIFRKKKGSPTAIAISTMNTAFHTKAGIAPFSSTVNDLTAAYPSASCPTAIEADGRRKRARSVPGTGSSAAAPTR